MKTKLYTFLLALAALAVTSTSAVQAQTAPPAGTPVITMTTEAYATIKLRNIQAIADNTPVWIEAAPGVYQTITVGTSYWSQSKEFSVTGTTLKVHGTFYEFDCSYNREKITALDISKNTALTELDCSGNQLSALDISKNTKLTWLNVGDCELTALDASQNKALTFLDCYANQLTTLNISNSTALTSLGCGANKLSDLNISNNTALTYLNCQSNQLKYLSVKYNTALTKLECNYNQLTALDVSRNTALTKLECYFNQLTALIVSSNTKLTRLHCSRNQLTALDVSRNTALTKLNCSDNELSTLNVSNNTALTELNCEDNKLSTLNVSKNTALTELNCGINKLTYLDISMLTRLKKLYCFYNDFTTDIFDEIYCALPRRLPSDNAVIYPAYNLNDINLSKIKATNSDNAKSKNWKVMYYNPAGLEVPTTGKNKCFNILYVGGVLVTKANAANITGTGITGKVSYNNATNTLTLNNAKITEYLIEPFNDSKGSNYGIKADADLIIDVVGNNQITLSGFDNNFTESTSYGIYSEGNVHIAGTGKCTLITKMSANAYSSNHSIAAQNITVSQAAILAQTREYGIVASNNLTISGNATIEVENDNQFMSLAYGKTGALSIYTGAKFKEGDSKAAAVDVSKFSFLNNSSYYYSDKYYIYLYPPGTGLETLTSQGIQVRGGKGEIRIDSPLSLGRGAGGEVAYVYNVSGMLVRTLLLPLQGAGGQVSVPAGIYIVRIGNGAEKVAVR